MSSLKYIYCGILGALAGASTYISYACPTPPKKIEMSSAVEIPVFQKSLESIIETPTTKPSEGLEDIPIKKNSDYNHLISRTNESYSNVQQFDNAIKEWLNGKDYLSNPQELENLVSDMLLRVNPSEITNNEYSAKFGNPNSNEYLELSVNLRSKNENRQADIKFSNPRYGSINIRGKTLSSDDAKYNFSLIFNNFTTDNYDSSTFRINNLGEGIAVNLQRNGILGKVRNQSTLKFNDSWMNTINLALEPILESYDD
ncbi:hypothetical protein HN992_03135 [Candidatus Woesearchaeota archaeon]|jgi:hypothetical protein|nr:hypothetical protein [Candidatus Woesearchaeota archaeon]MBT4057962.1 hypothetical protein [Candidatus Woesearchaeota archaeon]MBT5042647.1 hypothetical protein [Candidatus Woesearchaeota archaeon]MBT5112128.1 hypothetical protein [Candidatus Woesearchaeota archaeon]MBT6941410.1 hypothetical protein [Candidatus Woesearchaeota archaeon]